jgi:hypothetical protein
MDYSSIERTITPMTGEIPISLDLANIRALKVEYDSSSTAIVSN